MLPLSGIISILVIQHLDLYLSTTGGCTSNSSDSLFSSAGEYVQLDALITPGFHFRGMSNRNTRPTSLSFHQEFAFHNPRFLHSLSSHKTMVRFRKILLKGFISP